MAEDGEPQTAGRARQKLVDAKQRWAREGRGLTGAAVPPARHRLPPGQHEVASLPVLDLGVHPTIPAEDWTLAVAGSVARPLKWSWAQFLAQPQAEIAADIHCVTTWTIYGTRWTGVTTRHLLDLVQPRPEARFVMLKSHDGYSTNLPLDRFAAADVLIAHTFDGLPLPREHGGPVRLVVPQLYFWKSAKWLRAITFMEKDSPGYWELRGYHDEGDPWREERYR